MLAAERSTLNTYLRGETVEVPPHSIGFLLEGYIKSHSFVEELITSPAVMWPARGNSSFLSQESSGQWFIYSFHLYFPFSALFLGFITLDIWLCVGHKSTSFSHRGTSYSVETRARVILMDMATLQADSTLPKRKSSLSLHEQSSRSLTREHGSLLSWPEHHYNSHQHLADGKETDENRNNFSAKAMQLSMFGSTVTSVFAFIRC